MMCYAGQQMVFEEASDLLFIMKGVDINAKQIERVCHHYGGILEKEQFGEHSIWKSSEQSDQENNPHYVMVDGAMFLTREEKWKEIKLARLFKASDNIAVSNNRRFISQSTYIAHLGNHKDFFDKVEQKTDQLSDLVVVDDGAKWIWNWVESTYPKAKQILDYYHACEYIHQYADLHFYDKKRKAKWSEAQKELLLNNGIEEFILSINQLTKNESFKTKKELKEKIVIYFERNKNRMFYKTYPDNGWLIGSGAIESAHRHVLQRRLKLSGQRWTKQGLQKMANLRCVYIKRSVGENHTIV